MKTLSINNIIYELKGKDKIYLTSYQDKGYELGFGKGGLYKGHSHYFFYDILFSPDKIIIHNENIIQNNFLVVIPPRTFMNDIEIGDFFFIKFCPTNDIFPLPEKTDIVLNEGKIETYCSSTQLEFSWYKNPREKLSINIDATLNHLIIYFDNLEELIIAL